MELPQACKGHGNDDGGGILSRCQADSRREKL